MIKVKIEKTWSPVFAQVFSGAAIATIAMLKVL